MTGKTKTKQVLLVSLLSMAIILGALPLLSMAAMPTDIADHWAKSQITDWVSKGLVNGYPDGTFKPDKNISRAEFMALVNGSFGYNLKAANNYPDIPAGAWYADTVAVAKAAGYIAGYSDGLVKPNNDISRQEVAAVIAKIKKLASNTTAGNQFSDARQISNWSLGAVGAASDAKIMGGYPDGAFKAARFITRAEAIASLDRALKYSGASAGKYDKAGIFGPATGSQVIDGDVTVTIPGVTLQNLTIKGKLILAKEIAEGNVTLKNVTVLGDTQILGGGENSIIIINSTLGKVSVLKSNGKIRIVVSGSTKISELLANSSMKLEEQNLSGTGFEDIIIDAEFDDTIVFIGSFDTITVKSPGVNINIPAGTKVENLVLDEKVKVTGLGTIVKAEINASGVTFEKSPQTTVLASGVQAPTTNPTSSGGGGGGGGGSSIVTVSAINSVLIIPRAGSFVYGFEIKDALDEIIAYDQTVISDVYGVNLDTSKVTVARGTTGSEVAIGSQVSLRTLFSSLGTALAGESAAVSYADGRAMMTAFGISGNDPVNDIPTFVKVDLKCRTSIDGDMVSNRWADKTSGWIAIPKTANLTGLAISGSPVNYTFAAGTYAYTGVTVANGTASITVTPTGSGTIKLLVNGAAEQTIVSGDASTAIALTAGTPKTLTVLAIENGKTPRIYSVVVTRLAPGAAVTGLTGVLQLGETTAAAAATTEAGAGEWTSSDPSVATVDSATGEVNALSAGDTTIAYTISTSGRVNGQSITVYPAAAVDDPAITVVQVGEGTVTPTSFTAAGAGQTIAWLSSVPAKATIVGTTGVITPVTAGATTISYQVSDNVTGAIIAKGSLGITVAAAAVVDNPAIAVVQVGEGDVTPTGFTAAEAEQTIAWLSSVPAKATIDGTTGLITPVAAGATTISYQVSDDDSGAIIVKGSLAITVAAAAAVNDPAITVVQVGEGDVTPTSFTAAGAGQTIAWLSSIPANATIVETTGVITPVAAGATTISYHVSSDLSGAIIARGSLAITVAAAAVVDDPAISVVQVGEGDVTPTGFTAAEAGQTIAWLSSIPAKATIDGSTGVITPVATGATTISYQVSDDDSGAIIARGSLAITVAAAAAVNDPAIAAVQVGEADVTPTSFTAAGAGQTIAWLSSVPAKATIDGSTGVITAVAAGDTVISYQVSDDVSGAIIVRGSLAITVYAATVVNDPAITVVQVGEGTVTPTSFTAAGAGQTIAWLSSVPAKATIVSSTGVISPVASGDTTISYQVTDDLSGVLIVTGSLAITVEAAAVVNDPAIAAVQVGEADVTPTSFTAAGAGQTMAWLSSDPTKASIDGTTGVITALDDGDTTISYRVTDNVTGAVIAKGSLMITVLADLTAPTITAVDLHDITPASGFGDDVDDAIRVTFSETMEDNAASLNAADLEALFVLAGGTIVDGSNFDNVVLSIQFTGATTLIIRVTNADLITTNAITQGDGETADFGALLAPNKLEDAAGNDLSGTSTGFPLVIGTY